MFHKRLLSEFKENKILVAGMVFTQWVTLLANVILVYVLSEFVTNLLRKRGQGEEMTLLLLVLAVVLLVRAAMTVWNQKMSVTASVNVKRGLRERIFEKMMEFGTGYQNAAATSEIVQISTEGVDQLEIYFGKYVPQFFYSLLAPLTLFVIVGSMSRKVAVVLLLCVPLIPISIVAVQKFAKKLLKKYWGTYTELGDSFLENLQGLTTLKIYQADERYAKKMDEEAEKFRKVTMRVLIMQLNSISVMDLIAYGGAAIGMILSILEFNKGNITLAQCLFIILISAEFFLPLRQLGSFFHIAMNGNEAANKIFAFLDAEIPEKGKIENCDGDDISLSEVTFSYEGDKEILKQVSASIPGKSFTAIVGASGCGKSTIASILKGDQSDYLGSVKIGGVEVRDLEEGFLNRKITRIRHDSYLFQGTLKENLLMGKPDATEEELFEALKEVDLYDTVMKKGGLSMEIKEKAENLSGGQKQRLAMARAILHDSDIYIFDEATSNIDAESENKIMQVIHELAKTKTVILISHRLANVVKADRILVLKDGEIVEEGTHGQLVAEDGYYNRIYQTQTELEKYGEVMA